MFSPTGTGISTGICWKAESRNGPCRGPFLQSFRGKLFQGKSFLTPVKLRIKSVEVFGVKALLNEPEGFTETLEMDNLSCPQEADGVRHIGIPDCSEDVIVGRPGLLFRSHVFCKICDDIALGLELAGIERNAPGGLRPERRGMVDIIGAEAGVLNFFHGQVFGELIDDGADHFEMSEFVGTLRLSVIFIQVNSELKFPDGTKFYPDMQDGEYGFNTASDRGADTFHPFNKDFFKVARMYHTAAALNASYTAYHNYFVIPRDDLKSISFTCNAMSDTAENDVLAYNLPCVFIGSVVSYELLQQNGVILISPGRDVGNHKVKTVIYRNGSYTFDDFSDCYDYVAFGLGHWNGDYSRHYLTDVSIKLK